MSIIASRPVQLVGSVSWVGGTATGIQPMDFILRVYLCLGGVSSSTTQEPVSILHKWINRRCRSIWQWRRMGGCSYFKIKGCGLKTVDQAFCSDFVDDNRWIWAQKVRGRSRVDTPQRHPPMTVLFIGSQRPFGQWYSFVSGDGVQCWWHPKEILWTLL